ncbi:MAG: HEPN domain-containing protein [Candidatus Tectomicrobia bacterium]
MSQLSLEFKGLSIAIAYWDAFLLKYESSWPAELTAWYAQGFPCILVVQQGVQQARHDLAAVRWNIQGGFCDTACFLAQQAAEKAFQSLLYYLGARRTALLTRSLVEMVREGGKNVGEVANLLDDARLLDLHDIPSRYPNGLPGGYTHQFYSEDMAEQATRAEDTIVGMVLGFYRARGEEDILEMNEPYVVCR